MAAGSADFFMSISPVELERYYRGEASAVQVQASNGQVIQFPAAMLRQFVTPDGIEGRFRIEWDENGKLKSLVQL